MKAPGPSGSCFMVSRISAACSAIRCSARPRISACLLGKWWSSPPLLTAAPAATSSRVRRLEAFHRDQFFGRPQDGFPGSCGVSGPGGHTQILTDRLDGSQAKNRKIIYISVLRERA